MATAGPSPIECGICMETFSLQEHVPKCLPCGHTFCNICLELLNTGGQIICPNDETNHTVPVEGVKGFITNHLVTGLLDYSCQQCQTLGPTSRCRHCPGQFCATCLDHHVLSVFKSEVGATLDRVLSMKTQLQRELPEFVDRINNVMEDFDKFCAQSMDLMNHQVDGDILKEVDEKSKMFINSMKEVNDIVARRRPHVDSYLTCFSRNMVASHNQPMRYNSVPLLMLDSSRVRSGIILDPEATAIHERSGDIYVSDHNNERICVFDKYRQFKSEFDVNKPWDLCITNDGQVVVACSNDDTVKIYDASGTVTEIIGGRGMQEGKFDCPTGITTDDKGMLYICDSNNHRVQVVDTFSGSVVHVLGTSGPGQLVNPCSVAVHPQTRHIYVADYTNEQVNIYKNDGQYEASLKKGVIPGVSSWAPEYVSFRSDGLLCISDTDNSCVHLMRDGRLTQSVGKQGAEPGEFNYPSGTTFTASGDLIVCDAENHRLQTFAAQ